MNLAIKVKCTVCGALFDPALTTSNTEYDSLIFDAPPGCGPHCKRSSRDRYTLVLADGGKEVEP